MFSSAGGLLLKMRRRLGSMLSREQRELAFTLYNQVKALADPRRATQSRRCLAALSQELKEIGAAEDLEGGRAYLHFVYGFKQQEEFPFYAWLAIQSARFHNPGWPIIFVCMHEPTGPWWEDVRPALRLIRIEDFDYFRGARFHHYAHKADVVRLLMLRELGGVYLDMDTLTVKPFASLLAHEFGMAVQSAVHASAAGLCNAVMWGRPNARFVGEWLRRYGSFRSRGRDDHWDYHSVRMPALMIRARPDWVHILGHRAFFNPLWPDIERVLFSERGERYWADLQVAYAFHLWNGSTEQRLRAFTPHWVQTSKSCYARFARPVLAAALRDRQAGAAA